MNSLALAASVNSVFVGLMLLFAYIIGKRFQYGRRMVSPAHILTVLVLMGLSFGVVMAFSFGYIVRNLQ